MAQGLHMPDASPRTRPLAIAHRAGNDLSQLAAAFAAGVDYAEADVWLDRGRLEVRHEKTVGPIPILWERWTLQAGWKPRLLLDQVLAAAAGQGRLFLDLKGQAKGLAQAVAEAVERAGVAESVAFSTPTWAHLDRLRTLMPQAPRFYTVGRAGKLGGLRRRLERGEIEAVSIDSRLVTQVLIAELGAGGAGTIVTWGVETAEEARRVLACGVSGVTSDSLDLLASVRNGELSPSLP